MSVKACIAALACAVAAVGCGGPTALLLPTSSPRAEALSWFPEDTVGVVLAATEAPAAADLAARLVERVPELRRALPDLEQMRPLLGNELAVGVAHPGDAPLAVLVARDGSTLQALAEARENAGRAVHAGRYRGARLYAARGHAFATRHDVLVVSRSTRDLRDALDRRSEEDGLDEDDLPAGGAVARATVDVRPLLARAGVRLRAVPWLRAAERLDVRVRGDGDAAVAALRLTTDGEPLLALDVPVGGGRTGPRTADVALPRLAVRDFAHVLGVAERAAAQAAPLALLRAGPALDPARRLAAALHGPATLVVADGGWMLRADPSHPDRLDGALARLVRRLPQAGVPVVRRGALFEARGVRFGIVAGRLVAGTLAPDRLRELARAPLARPAGSRGSVALALPAEGLTGWLSATPQRLTGELRLSPRP